MHLFRDRGWAVRVPRPLQELGRRVKSTHEDMAHRLGRNPTVSELAKELGESAEDIEAAIDARRAYSAEPLLDGSADENESGAGERALEVIDEGFDRALDREALRKAIGVLDPRAREIVALRFLHDQTQSEIAEQLGISQMHVSRLLRRALAEMQSVLEPEAA